MVCTTQKVKKLTANYFNYNFILFFLLMPFFANAVVANQSFTDCKIDLTKLAEKRGFSPYIGTIISDITPIERVITLDKKQPEFTQSFQGYIKTRVTSYHIRTGKEKLNKHKLLFDKLEAKYGIPRQYLVSFWGLETYFGKHKGKMSVLNAITTLACDERRSEFFTAELFDLFTLIENKTVSVEQLKGSWAGAMGHMQFMPSAFLKYAVDGDLDGKIDIWNNEVDALTTAANYLNKIGWKTQERWGREVKVSEKFQFDQVVYDKYYPLNHFQHLRIKTMLNEALPNYNIDAEIYFPSGHQGPAFLLYPNFNVIMKWNLSKSYAISVGLLADKLTGSNTPSLIDSKHTSKTNYSTVEFKQLQKQLNSLGFATGEPDGIWGPKSRDAIRLFQLQYGLIADGYPNDDVFSSVKQVMSENIIVDINKTL